MLLVSRFCQNKNIYSNKNNSNQIRLQSKSDLVCFTSSKMHIVKKTGEISTEVLRCYPEVLGDNFKIFTEQLNSFLKKNNIVMHTQVLDSSTYGAMQIETIRGAGDLGLGRISEIAIARFSDKRGKPIGSTQMRPTKNAAIVQALKANAEIIQNDLKIELPSELESRLRKLDIALSVTSTKWMDVIKAPHDCDAKAKAYQVILKTLMPE